jgi:anti-sigma regulatory factor (Ser/Thr protein kinase)
MLEERNDLLFEKSFKIEGGDFIRAGEVSSSIKKILREIGIDNTIVRRLTIATFEAEMNVVCYAERGTLKLELTEGQLKVVIEDEGQGIENIDLAMREGYSTATDQIREMGFGAGMGLPNIKRNVDSFKIESTIGIGTKLEMIVKTKEFGEQV